MKPKLLFLFLGWTQLVSAQNFTEVTGTPFTGVQESSIAFADVDGDNDQDLLITGVTVDYDISPVGVRIAKLYANDGSGNFTEVTGTPFTGVQESSIAFADVDGDNDQDVLITGSSNTGSISKLYTNDGVGNFTEVIGTPFQGVTGSSIAFADVDSDNDQDVLITGSVGTSVGISKLYVNNGSGSFTEMVNTPFVGVGFSSIAFADVDGDNDQDVLITGNNGTEGRVSRLYLNNGSGSFTEMVDAPFEGAASSSIAFADVDGDNDQDVLITGNTGNPSSPSFSKVYLNDGSGSFTEMMDTPFEAIGFGSIAFTDVDGDNDQDVLITGGAGAFNFPYTGLYANDGSGNFTIVEGSPFEDLVEGSIAFADVDGDNDQDVILTGVDWSVNYTAKLYINDSVLSSSEDLVGNTDFKLIPFPNPAVNNLNLRFESMESNNVIIRVYDFTGSLMSQQEESVGVGAQILTVDIATLPAGSYLLQLDNGKGSGITKFIVQ